MFIFNIPEVLNLTVSFNSLIKLIVFSLSEENISFSILVQLDLPLSSIAFYNPHFL